MVNYPLRQYSKAKGAIVHAFLKTKSNENLNIFLQQEGPKFIYFGNLGKHERQFNNKNFIGLALFPEHSREIYHDATTPLPLDDNSVQKVQSQDVFEHISLEKIPVILDEIFRVLEPDGIFRLSLPDYRSALLKERSIYSHSGEVIGDLMMGAYPFYDTSKKKVGINFSNDGNAHLWFPTYQQVNELISKSNIKNCKEIIFHQCFMEDDKFKCDDLPDDDMFVIRSLPHDTRNNGLPISLVVDFIK